jgi:hypothetical protein
LSRLRALAALLLLAGAPGCEKLPAAPDLPNVPPQPAFFFTPVAPIYAGQTAVAFNGSGSRDEDGQVMSYVWNFGDGSAERTTTEPSIRYTFPDTGAQCMNVVYGVSLVVVDDKGGRGVFAQNVTVTELPAPSEEVCRAR